MKDNNTKRAFIEARAEGKSFSKIQQELNISKSTCSKWENDLKAEITELQREETEELYNLYGMRRQARIKSLGTLLNHIDQAITPEKIEELPADKLLELRLKYGKELKQEYSEPSGETLNDLLAQVDEAIGGADTSTKQRLLKTKLDTITLIGKEQRAEYDEQAINLEDYLSKIIKH